jgi:DNA-binding Lrp family transcriptional regulator
MKAYMGLSCKSECYDDVLKKLLFRMFIDPQDIHVLSGPVDLLIEFNGLRNLGEFVAKWFNPLRMISEKDELVTKILSFIVISESAALAEKPSAFVFMNARPRSLEEVRTRLLKLPEVVSAGSVIGPYDIISSVKTRGNSDLERVVSTIDDIPGVESSTASQVALLDIFSGW